MPHPVALLGNQFAEMCFSGTGKGRPSDIEARRCTTRTDFYPAAGFYSDSRKKRALADTHTSLCVRVSVRLCLSRALFSPAQMISIYLSLSPPSLPFLNANHGPVRAGRSLFKLGPLATRQPRCSVNHTFTIWKRKWGIQAVLGGTFWTYFIYLLFLFIDLSKSSGGETFFFFFFYTPLSYLVLLIFMFPMFWR